MSSSDSQAQWYLARDGQQYGPLSDGELGKFVDLGHLQPTDLLWREGFADWQPALTVFPPRKARNSTNAMMRKLMTMVRKLPHASTAPCFFASARFIAVTLDESARK